MATENNINPNIDNRLVAEQANRTIAEIQRDEALLTAAEQAAQRQQAEVGALNAQTRAQIAEAQALDARNQARMAEVTAAQLATERNLVRENLASEREAASNASFGFMFVTGIVLASLLGLAIWYFTTGKPDAATQTAMNASVPAERTVRVETPPPPVIVHNSPPVVVHDKPAKVIVERHIIKEVPAPKPAKTDNSDTAQPAATGTTGTDNTESNTDSTTSPNTDGNSSGSSTSSPNNSSSDSTSNP